MSTVVVSVVNSQGVNITTTTVATVAELKKFLENPVCCENSIGITLTLPCGNTVKAGRSYAYERPQGLDIRIGYFHNWLDDSNEYALVLKEWQEKIKCSS